MQKRISMISDLCIGSSVVDIGTDHGYLLINLYEKGFEKLLGVEVNQGPYDNCLNNILSKGMSDKISLILSDGLKEVKNIDYDNIVISGMGGNLIKDIISDSFDKFLNSLLILQPNNNEYILREFLNTNKFKITKEVLVEENSKIYEIIVAQYDSLYDEKLGYEDLYFGNFSSEYNRLLSKKWIQEKEYLENLIKNLQDNKINNRELEEKLNLINKRRKIYEVE